MGPLVLLISATLPIRSVKAIFGIDLAGAEFRALGTADGLVTVEKTLLKDLLPEMQSDSIWTAEKLEGLAIAADGKVYTVTDNDGLDHAPGETPFFNLGKWELAFDF